MSHNDVAIPWTHLSYSLVRAESAGLENAGYEIDGTSGISRDYCFMQVDRRPAGFKSVAFQRTLIILLSYGVIFALSPSLSNVAFSTY